MSDRMNDLIEDPIAELPGEMQAGETERITPERITPERITPEHARQRAQAALGLAPHNGQQTILDSRARFRVVACGRRFGKTEVGKLLVLERALRGESCWWLSPTYRMSNGVFRDFRRAVRTLNRDAKRGKEEATEPNTAISVNAGEREIEWPNGGLLAIRSAHAPDYLRGVGLDFVVLDEAAFMPPELWNEVVRPMLLERHGGAIFLSTPLGRNWFYTLYQRGLADPSGEWASFQFSTSANPLIAPDELATLREQTPDGVFRAEYLAEFVDNEGQVFRGIRAAVEPGLANAQPLPGGQYVAGVDWGRSRDYTVITVLDTVLNAVVALDRFNRVGWEVQRGRLAELCRRWDVRAVWAEANSIGSPNIEALQADGLPVRAFHMTAVSKPPLIERLALALERGDLRLPPDDTLIRELSLYTAERQAGGGFRYSAPPGEHDDCVISMALAWHAAQVGTGGLSFA